MSLVKDDNKIKNWKAYNAALCKRGSLTLWLSEDLYRKWRDIDPIKKVVGEKLYRAATVQISLLSYV